MSKLIDLTGQRFGRLTVLSRAENKGGQTYWKCQCDCGAIKDIRGTHLRNGSIVSCGCKGRENLNKAVDISGERFGKLTAIRISGKKNGTKSNLWECQCDCGNITYATVTELRNGSRVSCGCLGKEKLAQMGRERALDITGQRFGKLIALYPTDKREHQCVVWHCKCDCGNEYDAAATLLKNHTISSCGCLGRSLGEFTISRLLEENNIPFITQKTFEDCYAESQNHLLRFDFYVNNQYIIEFDGEQHYKTTGGWNNETHLISIKQRDTIKNEYCKNNNIPIIRIPYFALDNLTIDDLLLQTSRYLL